eukprot:348063-Pyramimonas_sp.AAC.3
MGAAASHVSDDTFAAAAAEVEEEKLDFEGDEGLPSLARFIRTHVEVKDRRYHMTTYKQCALGTEIAACLVQSKIASSAEEAVRLGQLLVDCSLLEHVTKDHGFKDEELYYRFAEDAKIQHGYAVPEESWFKLIRDEYQAPNGNLQSPLPAARDDNNVVASSSPSHEEVSPLDVHNAQLLDNVHPKAWKQPSDSGERYNMLVIGAGAGGLVTAAGSAGVGARVALITDGLMGGDCLNTGCVPSKALLRAAHAAHEMRSAADEFGLKAENISVDFGKIMERMRRLRAEISKNDAAERFASTLGVDVYFGRATFTSATTVEVNGTTLTFAKACVATGGSAAVPPMD